MAPNHPPNAAARAGSLVKPGTLTAPRPEQAFTARLADSHQPSDSNLFLQLLNPHGKHPSSTASARQYAEELGIKEDFPWNVSYHGLPALTQLPAKHGHSGNFKDWIGQESEALPAYLWDSQSFETVPATVDRLRQGYVAISWTWGRYQIVEAHKKQWRYTSGTEWRVPRFERVKVDRYGRYLDRLTHLKWLLRQMSGVRYFWIDILCINQDEDKVAEREQEIAKQSKIFSAARGVIAWLWTIEDAQVLGKIWSAFGGLLAWCGYFDPRQEAQSSARANGLLQQFPPESEWDRLFDRLRNDNWFTSLWALQELVLAPSALWMTHDGGFCTINGKPLTTRFCAVAVRFLNLLYHQREMRWYEEERKFVASKRIDELRFTAFREFVESEEYRLRTAVIEAVDQAVGGTQGIKGLVIETPRLRERDIPWVIECPRKDRPLQEYVQRWLDWSFGQACIDCSLSTSRAAILLAGRNREVIDGQSQEAALLAALKVERHQGFFSTPSRVGEHHDFSTNLLNLILQVEGLNLFDVIHNRWTPSIRGNLANSVDLTGWEPLDEQVSFLHVQDVGESRAHQNLDHEVWTQVTPATDRLGSFVEFKRNGRLQYVPILRSRELLLTDMSPCTASRLNSRVSHSTRSKWESHQGWHFHDRGILHIPSSARVQSITRAGQKTKIFVRPNGGTFEYPIDKLSDEKLIWRTQHWLQQTLGKPKFLLVPLVIRYRPTRKPKGSESTLFIEEPQVSGVVLVGKETLKKDQSLTLWHKFGTYHGWGEFEPLDYKDGILVTSLRDDDFARNETLQNCKTHIQRVDIIMKTLHERRNENFGDFEPVHHFEIFDNI